jgi:hypothetical protein
MFKTSCVLMCALCGGRVGPYSTTTQYTQLINFLPLILIINIPHDMWTVENIFINNYILDECAHHCIIYSVTAHPDDGQARPKYVGATN